MRPRISYTIGYKGIIVDNTNSYHPEKVDIMLTRSLDFVEGETPEQIQLRLSALNETEELLIKSVELSITQKVQMIRDRLIN